MTFSPSYDIPEDKHPHKEEKPKRKPRSLAEHFPESKWDDGEPNHSAYSRGGY